MVREIINVHVGQCGNQIANVFWETVCKEHHIGENGHANTFEEIKQNDNNDRQEHKAGNAGNAVNDDELRFSKMNVYFNESSTNRHVPRSCLVDLEPGTMDTIQSSSIGSLFKPDNFVFGASGAGNNWAKGHYTDGGELISEIFDVIRKESEQCECPQGFQLTHSLGGGTGSGLGTLILKQIRDEYPDRINCSFSVFPSPKVSDVVVEPYNAILSIDMLLENADQTFVIDNEALFNISHNILKQPDPKYNDLNWVISLVMSGITSSLRFPGQSNGDLRKMGVNIVPFPRLHFFLVAQAPLFAPIERNKINLNVQEVTQQMWSSKNFMSNIKYENGKYLTAFCGFRGRNISTQEVDYQINNIQNRMSDDFVEWIPNNIKTNIIEVAPQDTPVCGTFVANTTAIKHLFSRISSQFARFYKRKAYLHWYAAEGMDSTEFEQADQNVRDLISEYIDRENVVIDLKEDDDDDDDDLNDDNDEEEDDSDDNDDDESESDDF